MTKKETKDEGKSIEKKKVCGIIMPISGSNSYTEKHWKDVFNIIKEAVEKTGFNARIVSDSNISGLILDRIVTNIYEDELVICDVSSKNPNVMFELGMRLAFDKPTIVIKDEKTDYNFDTSPIDHIPYPSNLDYYLIKNFQDHLIKMIEGTLEEKRTNKNHSPFLQHFGRKIKPGQLGDETIETSEYLIQSVKEMRSVLNSLRFTQENNIHLNTIDNDHTNYIFNKNVKASYLAQQILGGKDSFTSKDVQLLLDKSAKKGYLLEETEAERILTNIMVRNERMNRINSSKN